MESILSLNQQEYSEIEKNASAILKMARLKR